MELDIPFLLERDSVRVGTVTEVYTSHIGFKGIHGITVEVKWGPKGSNERIHRQVNPL